LEKGKFVRIIGPLIGFRLGENDEMIPALNPTKVMLITNIMDIMGLRL